jgi:hypothetical protein
MKKTTSWGTVFPYATMKLNDPFGTFFCAATGTTPLTTTMAPYVFSCTTTSPISMSATDRFLIFPGYSMTVGPGNHNMEVHLSIENGTPSTAQIPDPVPAQPAISSLSINWGVVGEEVTINGNGFGQTQQTSTVAFNGVVAPTPTSWSDSSIRVDVPPTTSGSVVVAVNGQTSNSIAFAVSTTISTTVVSVSHQSGTTLYTYSVWNRGHKAITGIILGNDNTKGTCVLTRKPIGWTVSGPIPSSGAGTPLGWNGNAFSVEEDIWRLCVEFDGVSSTILPGAVQTGFTLTLEQEDSAYLNGPVMVIFDDGSSELAKIGS